MRLVTASATFAHTTFVSVRDLAARWGVHEKTARGKTFSEGFPEMVELGPRSHRWVLAEVTEWEMGKRRKARRVHASTLPQRGGLTLPAGVTMRRAA